MSQNLETNKIFAAILVAAITAMLAGFVAHKLVHPHELHEDAVAIDGGAVASSGFAKPQTPEPIMAMLATADIARGEKLSKACAACHSFDNGGVNKVGPNLWNIVNRPIGEQEGFAYSAACVATPGDWDYDSLNKFLWKPKSFIEGTKMNYLGMKKPGDRAAMIAWLRTLSPSPAALPTTSQILEEAAELAPPAVEDAVEGAVDAMKDAVGH